MYIQQRVRVGRKRLSAAIFGVHSTTTKNVCARGSIAGRFSSPEVTVTPAPWSPTANRKNGVRFVASDGAFLKPPPATVRRNMSEPSAALAYHRQRRSELAQAGLAPAAPMTSQQHRILIKMLSLSENGIWPTSVARSSLGSIREQRTSTDEGVVLTTTGSTAGRRPVAVIPPMRKQTAPLLGPIEGQHDEDYC